MSNEEMIKFIIEAIKVLDQPEDARDRARLRNRLVILLELS